MDDLFSFFTRPNAPLEFEKVRITIASPDKIREWSYGEVKKPETINYRTFKPEREGLFCAKIFGPVKDFECNCGKYKRMKHRGVVCEKCGVEVIQSKVRRERMGHIDLASPVAHIWFLKCLPSKIGNLLDMSLRDLEKVLYFEAYVVVESDEKYIQIGTLMNEEKYRSSLEMYPGKFKIGIGAEAIQLLLKNIDLESLSLNLRDEIKLTGSAAKRSKFSKRLQVVESFFESGNRPEWMILDVIPVLPPDLRPLVPLEGGRFATSDLNDLYRRVINRNNRLKRLLELDAPDIIIRNEKRMLQEAVDVLFDNGRRGRVVTGTNKRPLKSLSDMLKGKQGRFRQNLLGKRVDYSGRSVIVVGPHLRLHQCGLPKKMALELFKPFIYQRLEAMGLVNNIKSARKMVEKGAKEVWDVLEDVVTEYPVILNRAPTLHRLGMQAFEALLVEGKAIQLHPLVCMAFNADFDGDQMAVHIPLSVEAQIEARVLMMSTNNILSPANGEPIIIPTQDIVLGIYYITRLRPYAKGEGKFFSCVDEAKVAFEYGDIHLQAQIYVRISGNMIETTVGRLFLFEIIPNEVSFAQINKVMTKKELARLIDSVYRRCGTKKTVILADRLKDLGYEQATRAGISIGVNDMLIPVSKEEIIEKAEHGIYEVEEQYKEGLITSGEKYNLVVDIWTKANDSVANEMMNEISVQYVRDFNNKVAEISSFNPIFMMADSGARGSKDQIRQLAGMRGLMAKPSGAIIETPIRANFREGLGVLEYFISTHGARKGLADTALKTANSGYLTRRLVDVAQDSTIVEIDCGTVDGILAEPLLDGGEIIVRIGDRILGRVALEDVIDPINKKVLVHADNEINESCVELIETAGINRVMIRSVLTCRSRRGVCSMCYGRDLGRGHIVNVGEAVGIIAAQSIGEPGTQLTMRTFHIGGTASRRVEQAAIKTQRKGKIHFTNLHSVTNKDNRQVVMNRNSEVLLIGDEGRELERYTMNYGAQLYVVDGAYVEDNTKIAEWDPFTMPIISEVSGTIKYGDIIESISMQEKVDPVTGKTTKVIIQGSRSGQLNPRITIKDEKGKTLKLPNSELHARYSLPVGTIISVNDGDIISAGTIIGRIFRETTKTKDITGGLPRVAELFEVRKPKEYAVITEIDGRVNFGKDIKGKKQVLVVPDFGEPREYFIPKGKALSVHDGDFVKAGEALMDGTPQTNDILRVLGIKELAKFLVNEVQDVYRLQGVKINDKHIEVIVRQMLRRVQITEIGESDFMFGEQVEWWKFMEVNDVLLQNGKQPSVAEPMLLGITKASLSTDSFISAASFQETTKVLTNAAISGKIDTLCGLKENVIMGRLIPAGSGLKNNHLNNMNI